MSRSGMRGDTLYAPGSATTRAGSSSCFTRSGAMNVADLRTEADVLFIGTVGEEGLGDLRGVKHLFREGGPRIDAFIAVDGGERRPDRVPGARLAALPRHLQGPGRPLVGRLRLVAPRRTRSAARSRSSTSGADAFTREGARTSYSVGRIGGGTSVNSIPFEAWMEVDMRSESQERLMEIDSIFRATMHDALAAQNAVTRRGPALEVEIELVGDRPSGETALDAPLLRRTIAATRFFGDEPTLTRSSTDANVPISLGIPAVTISRGGLGGRAHSLDEFWVNRDGPRAIKRAVLLLLAEGGMAEGKVSAR